MVKIPTVLIQEIYAKAKRNVGVYVKQGSTYKAKFENNGEFELIYYGGLIFFSNEEKKQYFIGRKAYSASDRDAINSMMHILGIEQKYSIAGGRLHALENTCNWEIVNQND